VFESNLNFLNFLVHFLYEYLVIIKLINRPVLEELIAMLTKDCCSFLFVCLSLGSIFAV